MLDRSLVAIALIGLAVPALAQDARRQLEAHTHGEGQLAIAIEGKRVEMELTAPASDIIGFEHAPRTKAQRKTLADARVQLGRLAGTFALAPAAGCKLVSADVDVLGAAAGTKGKSGHDHGHDHDHDGNAHAGKDDGHEHGTHSEFKVTYAIACDSPDKLASMTFDYFKTFKGAEKLNVTVIGPKGQSGYVVTRDKPVLDLSGVS
jgi:hypothetical protein